MNAPSFQFLGFAVVGAVLFNLSGALIWRRLVLLALNLVFFALFASGVVSVLPFAAFLLTGYLGVVLLRNRPSQGLFLAFLALVLFEFFWLKRYSFIPGSITLPFVYVTIGLSYVFFRVLHLVIEAQQGGLKARVSPLSYVNYTLNFPALISGPIQLYPDYHRMESQERLPLDVFVVGEAAWRVAIGFFKVVIVSALLMKAQQACIAALGPDLPFASKALYGALIGAIYPFFLYANFSGYTDFVIGVAKLYRFDLPENFNNPFVSENFIAFWSRWHITLSSWLKTYVYTPVLLTCMRRVTARWAEPYFAVLAYFITFFLVGAWHGQTSMFLFFGVLQGGGVAANKLYQIVMGQRLGRAGYRKLSENVLYRSLSRGLTFTWFAFTLLWFWSSWSQLGGFISALGAPALLAAWSLVFITSSAALAWLAEGQVRAARHPWLGSRYVRTVQFTVMVLIVLISVLIVGGPAPDIVYKNF
ncbi:MAG: MBOAT family O-acyltransferase [Caulobacteraceae bacterium]|nr:MBOAT family O-acyltransferase [Caulobacteraceae bacterium]